MNESFTQSASGVKKNFITGVLKTFKLRSRKELEVARLEESEILFRKVADEAPCLMWRCSAQGEFDWFNQGWLYFTGKTHDDQKGHGWVALVHQDDLPSFQKLLTKSIRTQESFTFEFRLRRSDNQFRWIELRANPRLTRDRKFLGFVGIGVDVHEEHVARENLLRTEERLRLATEVSKVGIWEVNLRTGDMFTSKNHDEAFGYGKSIKGWSFEKFEAHLHPEDRERVVGTMRSHIEHMDSFEITTRVVWPDGTVHWMDIVGTVEPGEDGRPLRMVGTNVDITEKKRNEEMLHEALFYRDEFLSIASHELKTPLTSLKLQSQIFKRNAQKKDPAVYDRDRIDRLMDQTDKQVSRLVRLVDDMLDISRIRTGRLSMNKETVELNAVICEVIDRIKPQFADLGACVPLFKGCEEVHVTCDRIRIEQVLTNILNNALRYGLGKPVQVSLSRNPDRNVRIEIKDQGMGIAKEHHEKIFTRFQRAVPASEVSGLGLGLYIARQIVDAHRGKLWVESERGHGATFIVLIPGESA